MASLILETAQSIVMLNTWLKSRFNVLLRQRACITFSLHNSIRNFANFGCNQGCVILNHKILSKIKTNFSAGSKQQSYSSDLLEHTLFLPSGVILYELVVELPPISKRPVRYIKNEGLRTPVNSIVSHYLTFHCTFMKWWFITVLSE